MLDNDIDAWEAYPTKRQFFNKLWFSEQQGYVCGPVGVPIPKSAEYVTRPIYNLHGMGAGAIVKYCPEGMLDPAPLGHFWCEYFEGPQYTVDFIWNGWDWDQANAFCGHKEKEALYKFQSWRRVDMKFKIPQVCKKELKGINFNVEYIADKPIEVHLRVSPDPVEWDEYIPVWEEGRKFEENIAMIDSFKDAGYHWVAAYDDACGYIKTPRIGFWCRKNQK